MEKYKNNDIIKVKVSGIQEYGVFVNIDNEYTGLIHISEISYGYVSNINDFIKIGDKIYAKIINIDENKKQLNLSIKDINYADGSKLKRIAETKSGFKPLEDHLEGWINLKIKEIMDKI